jgi:hypothetical protein
MFCLVLFWNLNVPLSLVLSTCLLSHHLCFWVAWPQFPKRALPGPAVTFPHPLSLVVAFSFVLVHSRVVSPVGLSYSLLYWSSRLLSHCSISYTLPLHLTTFHHILAPAVTCYFPLLFLVSFFFIFSSNSLTSSTLSRTALLTRVWCSGASWQGGGAWCTSVALKTCIYTHLDIITAYDTEYMKKTHWNTSPTASLKVSEER